MDVLLASIITIVCCCLVFEALSSLRNFRLIVSVVVGVLCFNYLASSQSCYNSSTAINGKAFPPLIEATVEDIAAGLEAKLFTSVDLVNV